LRILIFPQKFPLRFWLAEHRRALK
jgi:hypothetical protein